MIFVKHQYIERETRKIKTEYLYGDKVVRFLYSGIKESAPWLFRQLTSAKITWLLSYANYRGFLAARMKEYLDLQRNLGISVEECLEPLELLDTPQKIFE